MLANNVSLLILLALTARCATSPTANYERDPTTGSEGDVVFTTNMLASFDTAESEHQNMKRKKETERYQHKYFHEAGGSMDLGHYDKRYFVDKVPYEAHRPALRHLIRSYLLTLRELGVDTWLAHGSLLGWWWNGRIMPWDYDLDVQVSVATLAYLGERLNGSVHEYTYTAEAEDMYGDESEYYYHEDFGLGKKKEPEERPGGTTTATTTTRTKRYLLDVNPHYAWGRGNAQNLIDARWIDMDNGLFIDITGLAERDARARPGIWSCKNRHAYATADLWPMRQTEFEGVPAVVPYAFDDILMDEYGAKSLTKTQWAGHRWNPERKEWIKKEEQDPPAVKTVVVVVEVQAPPKPKGGDDAAGNENTATRTFTVTEAA